MINSSDETLQPGVVNLGLKEPFQKKKKTQLISNHIIVAFKYIN